MKARWFFLVICLAFSTALLGIDAAGAKPPGTPKPPKTPPPGTPGVAAKSGTPGTITITHYTADGLTILGVERVQATASDSSASVAARLGRAAPEAVKVGVVTDWDDLGRPNAPVAQIESAAGTRTTASAKRVARRSDCCSSSGCDAVEVTRDIDGDIFGDWIGTFHHRVYWCWSYPKITGVNVDCWSTVDGGYIDDHGCDGWGNYYRWSGSGHGGHALTARPTGRTVSTGSGASSTSIPGSRSGSTETAPGRKTKEVEIAEFEKFFTTFLTKILLFLLILFVIGAIVSFIKFGY